MNWCAKIETSLRQPVTSDPLPGLQDRLLQPRARAPLRPAIKTAAINSHQRSAEVLSIHQFCTILSGDVEFSWIFYHLLSHPITPTAMDPQQCLIDGTYMCTSASKHCTDATGLATASWGSDTSPPKYPHRHGSWSKTAAWMAWFVGKILQETMVFTVNVIPIIQCLD
jgi:hypothetical protein